MRKVFLVLAVVVASLLVGCAGGENTYTDSEGAIEVKVGKEFVVILGSNPTTGYSWQESYDNTMLQLVDKTYKPGKAAEGGTVGAGGEDHFRFKALKKGKTEITMSYQRPWEQESGAKSVFSINIK